MGPGMRVLNSFSPRWWGIRPSKNCPEGWSHLELMKSYLFGSKLKINVLIWGRGAYAWSGLYEGAYTWSNRCVKENVKKLPRGMVTLGID